LNCTFLSAVVFIKYSQKKRTKLSTSNNISLPLLELFIYIEVLVLFFVNSLIDFLEQCLLMSIQDMKMVSDLNKITETFFYGTKSNYFYIDYQHLLISLSFFFFIKSDLLPDLFFHPKLNILC